MARELLKVRLYKTAAIQPLFPSKWEVTAGITGFKN